MKCDELKFWTELTLFLALQSWIYLLFAIVEIMLTINSDMQIAMTRLSLLFELF
jgi:hypothetical protein